MPLADLDRRVASTMARLGVPALRVSLAVIFIWFGALKPLGLSPAGPLVEATVGWMPVFTSTQWVSVIGWWEVAVGVTFLPLVMLPEITFQAGRYPFVPTIEGQYIIKSLLIISAALVVGGTVKSVSP